MCVCVCVCVWREGGKEGGKDLVDEGGSSEHHGQLAGVVGVIEPARVSGVPGMEPPRKANYAVSGLSPYSA